MLSLTAKNQRQRIENYLARDIGRFIVGRNIFIPCHVTIHDLQGVENFAAILVEARTRSSLLINSMCKHGGLLDRDSY